MNGRLIAVVGPSGVGKDSVMAALAQANPSLVLVRRVITRDAAAGGEAFDAITQDQFDQMAQDGAFALHWQAHGLSYGIPKGALDAIHAGETRVVNLSRTVLKQAQAVFGSLAVLSLTAQPDILAQRLMGRNREDSAGQHARLARAGLSLPTGLHDVYEIDNSGALEDTVQRCLNALGISPKHEVSQ